MHKAVVERDFPGSQLQITKQSLDRHEFRVTEFTGAKLVLSPHCGPSRAAELGLLFSELLPIELILRTSITAVNKEVTPSKQGGASLQAGVRATASLRRRT